MQRGNDPRHRATHACWPANRQSQIPKLSNRSSCCAACADLATLLHSAIMAKTAGKRKRSETAPSKIAPIVDDRPLWCSFRWTITLRTVLVKLMLNTLTVQDMFSIMKGGNFPQANKSAAYNQIYAQVCALIEADNKKHGLRKKVKSLPSPRAVTEHAKDYTRKFLQHGHVHDKAANWVGRRVDKHLDTLQEMHEIILAGYQPGVDGCEYDWSKDVAPPLLELLRDDLSDDDDSDGSFDPDEQSLPDSDASSTCFSAYTESVAEDLDDGDAACATAAAAVPEQVTADSAETILPFRSIEQVQRMRPRFAHLAKDVLRLKTPRGILSMLQQAFPKLRKVAMTATKARDHEKVQVRGISMCLRLCICAAVASAHPCSSRTGNA